MSSARISAFSRGYSDGGHRSGDVFEGCALAEWQLGEAEKALKLVKDGLSEFPDHADLKFTNAAFLGALKREGEAREVLEQMKGVSNCSHYREYNLGDSYLNDATAGSNRLERARYWLERAVKCWPKDSDAQRDLGTAYLLSGNFEEAIRVLGVAVALNAKNSTNYWYRATALACNGRFGEAAVDLDSCIKAAPSNADCRELRGMLEARGPWNCSDIDRRPFWDKE